jgi:AcrR family transcriptional regulator
MSPRPRQIDQQANLNELIKETVWKQIAEFGAPTLSLRAVARELGITAPAIYNYFPSRDDLVTALIVDAYNSLADSQEAAAGILPVEDLSGRLSTLGLAYRQWAVTYPQRYLLIFGTPIPNYHAPEEVTVPAATRALVPLIGAIQALSVAKRLQVDRVAPLTPRLESMLKFWGESAGGIHPEVLYLALVIWSRVHGLVMLEITNQIPSIIDEPAEVFRCEIQTILIQYLQEKP